MDRGIEELKRSNRMIDLQSEAARNVTESSRYKAEGLSLENQIAVARFVSDYLRDPAHAGELIPMAASVASETVAAQIDRYNEAILTRSRLLANGSEQNPVPSRARRAAAGDPSCPTVQLRDWFPRKPSPIPRRCPSGRCRRG